MMMLIMLIVLFLQAGVAESQNSVLIKGKVVAKESGEAIANASVAIKDSYLYSFTDSNGYFQLYVNKNNGDLIVSAKGFETEKQSYNGTKVLTIKLNVKTNYIEKNDVKTEEGMLLHSSEIAERVRDAKFMRSKDAKGEGGYTASIMLSDHSAPPAGAFEHTMPYPDDAGIRNDAQKAEAGLLTAGEVNDFAKWVMWNDIAENDLAAHKETWKLFPLERYTVQIENEFRNPVFGANVKLLDNNYVVWSAKSDNTGKAELWHNPFTNYRQDLKNISIEIEYKGKFYFIKNAKKFAEGMNFFQIQTGCLKPKFADIAFLVDATGSMGDEINYLKMDLKAIMKDITDTIPEISFNTAAVFYRDSNDAYITRYSDFSSEIDTTSEFISNQEAGGGGDFPEAVHRGLDVAINNLSWREDAMTKVIFIVLDAPPHSRPEVTAELQAHIHKASEKGIRIIPLACSGVDKSTEYFLRAMALLTNGTYTFLTDDSGIGNPHIKPTTDKFDVETLRQLLVRLVYQYSYYSECETEYPLIVSDTLSVKYPDTGGNTTNETEEAAAFSGFRYYPNPTFGELNIEFSGKPVELFIADVNGKIIFRLDNSDTDKIFINLEKFPSGMYFIMYQYQPDKWLKGKVVLMH